MGQFEYMETTVQAIHAAITRNEITCRDVVEFYIGRIDALDKKGPCLNSVILINPKVREEAERLDDNFKKT